MKKNGFIAFFVALCCTAYFMLAGCTVGSRGLILINETETGDKSGIRLSFFGYKADLLGLAPIEKAIRGFMAQYPDTNVVYEGLKGDKYWYALDKRVESDDLDDVFTVDHSHVRAIGKAGKLADLSSLSTIDAYIPLVKEQFTNADGSVYFLPACISAFGLYVNRDLLKAHGQKIPENLSEFAAACDYFVSRGITPVVVNNDVSLQTLIIARGMFDVYRKERPSEEIEKFNQNPALLKEQLRPGFGLAETMINKGWIDCEEALVTERTVGDIDLFAVGDRPFMIADGWASPRVKVKNPTLDYGVYPYPVMDDGSVLVIDTDICLSVSAYGKNPETAKKFVEFFTTPDVMWELCESQSSYMPTADGRLPTDKTVAPSARYISNGRNVICSNYKFTLPVDSSVVECTLAMMSGMTADKALNMLERLLSVRA